MTRKFLPSLASFVQAAQAKAAPSEAETKAIAQIEKAGGRVLKIAQNDVPSALDLDHGCRSVSDPKLKCARKRKSGWGDVHMSELRTPRHGRRMRVPCACYLALFSFVGSA